MFEKYLQELGLSEKEAKVYLTLLQFDSASIQEIADKSEINRTTVYPLLESLSKKGLVSELQNGKKTEYEAAPPERLETFVERQKVVLQEHSERLKDIIPQIKSIQKEKGERPVIKLFEGRDGAISAYEEFWSFDASGSGEKTGYFAYDFDKLAEIFTPKEKERFLNMRAGKDIFSVTVYNRKEGDQIFKTKGQRIRIDEKEFPISVDMSVIEDRVVITTLGEQITSFLIKSEDIANTFKTLIKRIHSK